jgi:hypothetical protein
MYKDIYLSFPDEATANDALYRIEGAVEADPEAGIEAQEGYPVPNFANIDTIGVIYKPTGWTIQTDEGPVPEMAPIDGWHVNVRVLHNTDTSVLDPYVVTPVTPMRVWAG